jgi:NAD+ diphosphatase
MIGCLAEAESRDFQPDGEEIAEARWLDRATARALLAGETRPDIAIPPAIAIAHHLIKAWAAG